MLKHKNPTGHAFVIILLLFSFIAIGTTGYFVYKSHNDVAVPSTAGQITQNTALPGTKLAFTLANSSIEDSSLKKGGDYTVDGDRITIFVAIGHPVGCEDKILDISQQGTTIIFNVQATTGRTKDRYPSKITVQLGESINEHQVKINLIKKCH